MVSKFLWDLLQIKNNMKKIIFFAISFALIFASSCNKDLGNYSYSTLDTLGVTNFPDTLEIELGSEINITPKIISDNPGFNTQELVYEWYAFNKNVANQTNAKIFLGEGSKLIMVPKMQVGNYPCYLRITQPSTGRIWTNSFYLKINGKIGKIGFFILSDKNKKAHLDYFQDDPNHWNSFGKIYRDVNQYWNSIIDGGPFNIDGEPKNMEVYVMRKDFQSAQKSTLFINSGDRSYMVNQTDNFTYNPVDFTFRSLTSGGTPEYADQIIAADDFLSMAIKDNNIYVYGFLFGKLYNVPLNSRADGSSYPVSPFVAMPMANYQMNTMIFDTEGKAFMRLNAFSSRAFPVSATIPDFNPANTGMDLIYLGHSMASNGQAVAIMKKDSKRFLVRFTFTSDGTIMPTSILDVTSSLTDIAGATNFALDNKFGYLFYTANDKLYQYDIDAKRLKVAKTLNGRKVSMLKSERYVFLHTSSQQAFTNPGRMEPLLYSVILGTYDEKDPISSGKVEFLHVQGLMGDLKETIKPMSGFGIVKDIQYTDLNP